MKAANYLARKLIDLNPFTLDPWDSFANNSYAACRIWDRFLAYVENYEPGRWGEIITRHACCNDR